MNDTAGKLVVVTGGTRGLGLAIVKSLRSAGYTIATCGRKLTDELEALLGKPEHKDQLFWKTCEIGGERDEEQFFRTFSTGGESEHSGGWSTMQESQEKASWRLFPMPTPNAS